MSTSCLRVFYFKSDEWSLAARRQLLQSNLKLHPPPALCLSTLYHACSIHGDAVAALPPCQTIFRAFCRCRTTSSFILSLAETVDPIEPEFFIRKAQVSYAWLGPAAARTGVDYGVTDAAVLQPAGLTAVQKLELPCCVQLTHFGHHRTVSNAGLHRLPIVHLLKAFEEVHFAWGVIEREERMFIVRTREKVKSNRASALFRSARGKKEGDMSKREREAPETSRALRVDILSFPDLSAWLCSEYQLIQTTVWAAAQNWKAILCQRAAL